MRAESVALSRFAGDLEMANRAPRTVQQYVASARRFEEFLGHDLVEASQESVRRWVDVLRQQAIGASRLGQHDAALKFLYARTLGQPERVAWITIPKAKAPLPSILARVEIQRLLEGFTNAKYRMFFTLIYATGLRIPSCGPVRQLLEARLTVLVPKLGLPGVAFRATHGGDGIRCI
jgi:site-specific recombinase XerD